MPLRIALSLLLAAAGLIVVEAAGLGARLLPAAGTATRWLVVGGLAGALFLLLLLLLGVRRDPLAVLAERLERFRVRFLEEVAVTPGGLDRGRWRRELQSHKDEVRTQLLAATRRLSRGRRRRAEAMFEAGWQRLVDYLERRAGEAPATLDGAAIERLIEAALAPPGTARPAARPPVSDRLRQAPTPPPQRVPQPSARAAAKPQPVPVPPTRRPPSRPLSEPAPPSRQTAATAQSAPAPPPPVLSLEPAAFLAAVTAARKSVVLEGGVYRVRQELYGKDPPAPRDPTEPRSLRRVAAESAPTDERLGELVAAGRRAAARQLPVTPLGVDLDHLLAGDAHAQNTAARAQVLDLLRASMDAAGAALLVDRAGGYRSAVTCGNLAYASGELQFGRGNPLYDTWLADRRCLIVAAAAGQRYAFVPAILDESRAYLVFLSHSVPAPVQWNLEFLIARLDLYPA